MIVEWRPLPAWPYPKREPKPSNFEVSWGKTLDDLEKEIDHLKGSDVLIGVVADPSSFRMDGTPRAGWKPLYRAAEVSFNVKGQRRTFHTDAFRTLQENLRAISLGLTALRAIDRYGITTSGEQYAGFAMLPSGGPDADRGRALVAEAGSVAKALHKHHPDHGGTAAAFADVQAYRERAGL